MHIHYIHVSQFLLATIVVGNTKAEFCPKVYHKGVLRLDINPAFLNADEYNTIDGGRSDGLTISSFFNHKFSFNKRVGKYMPDFPPFAPDQVGRIRNIHDVDLDDFDFATDYEKLPSQQMTWPNDARRIPDGMLPFEGVIVPQGFHPIPTAGRLTIFNLADLTEYVVHEGTLDLDPPVLGGPNDMPKFFHKALFSDMDGDGKLDVVTVRSGFKVIPSQTGNSTVYPPFSELVYYKNPGDDIDPNVEWEERVLYGGPFADPPFMGPDIHLAMHDFDGDGVDEIVATHFFTGDDPKLPQPTKGKIVLYGAPFGDKWSDVNAMVPTLQPRVKLIDDLHGFPFGVDIVDLDGDGKMDIIATNHQTNCFPGVIPGQIYALQQPASGKVFDDDWTVRVLVDGIRPQPTPKKARGTRLAPGHAIPFHPKEEQEERGERPWILVSGDEAGKVWIMKPVGRRGLAYETAIVFDINDYYGDNTTQTFTSDGYTISTIGEPAIFYDEVDTDSRKDKVPESMSRQKKQHGYLKGGMKRYRQASVSQSHKSRHSLSDPSMTRHYGPNNSKSMNQSRGRTSKHHSKSKGSKRRDLAVLKRSGFLRHERRKGSRVAKIYIPVFEAKEIHVLSFDGDETERIDCPDDVTYDCSTR